MHEIVRHATAADGSDVGYTFNLAVQSEEDTRTLHPRSRRGDRKERARQKELLEDKKVEKSHVKKW